MRRTAIRAASTIALGALSLLGVAAHVPDDCYVAIENDATDPSDDVIACEIDTYVADPSGKKVGNAAVTGQSSFPTFSPDEPTASVSTGAGAGYLGTSLLQLAEPNVDATGLTIKGEVTGTIDALALTLHGMHSGYGRLPFPTAPLPPSNPNPTAPVTRSGMTAYVSLEIDGFPIMPVQTTMVDFTTDPAPTASASMRYRANITGIAKVLDEIGIANGPGDVRQVTLRVTPRYVNTDPAVVFLYGTSEVPSQVLFNPVTLVEGVKTVALS